MRLKNVISEPDLSVLRREMIVAFLTGWVTSAFTKDSLKTYKSIFNAEGPELFKKEAGTLSRQTGLAQFYRDVDL